MGIYLGQLPPAEIARLKAELAETLIANFCYPRYFDQRTDSLRTRPVDRAKRQEVWLYLSSFDFTAWGRVDLMTVEFQHCIERLLIQFVQRNRSFFGAQGRRRMLDVRMLIGGVAVEVVQGLRGHLAGQKQGFGNPKEVVSWGAAPANGRSDLTWEQISAATMLLQQQLQEWRGEVKPGGRATQQGSGQMPARRRRSQPLGSPSGSLEHDVAQPVSSGAMRATVPSSPGTRAVPPPSTPTAVPSSPAATPVQARMVRESRDPADQPTMATEPVAPPAGGRAARRSETGETIRGTVGPGKKGTPSGGGVQVPPSNGVQDRVLAPAASSVSSGQREVQALGEDDVAIFEQLRHQMLLWLRVEAVRAGLDISGYSPMQLLDLLRQNARCEETRLQVVSTLLNLANQVIKTGAVSVLDYKQALMFHLMHTRP